MIAALTKGLLLPGDLVCNLIGARESDDRGMMRTLVNMLFWNLIGAFAALHFSERHGRLHNGPTEPSNQ